MTDPTTVAEVRLPYDAKLADAWTAVPGARIDVDIGAGTITIRMRRRRVALPAVGLPAGTVLTADVMFAKPNGSQGVLRVRAYGGGALDAGLDVL